MNFDIKNNLIPDHQDRYKDKWIKPCINPSHEPPMLLYIPPGESHVHICPGCGQQTVMSAPYIYC